MEQFRAELPFERCHCRRYRGRGKSESVGRARDVFALGNRDKDLQLIKRHAAIPTYRPVSDETGAKSEQKSVSLWTGIVMLRLGFIEWSALPGQHANISNRS